MKIIDISGGILKKILKFLFICACIIIFLYETQEGIRWYLEFETLTSTFKEKQNQHPLPWICVEAHEAPDSDFAVLNLTSDGYRKQGQWKNNLNELDEESSYNMVSKRFEDLFESGTIEAAADDSSDSYETHRLTSRNVNTTRCDFYSRLKCYCISFPQFYRQREVQEMKLNFRSNVVVSVVAPGNFYSRERKQSRIRVEKGYKYDYVLEHTIVKHRQKSRFVGFLEPDTGTNNCTHETKITTDDCKLSFINNKITTMMNCTTPWLLFYAR